MNIARYNHSLVSLHGRLYAIGGVGGFMGGFRIDSDEVYDPENNTWTLLQHKVDKMYYNGADVIKECYLKQASNGKFKKNCLVM